MDARTLLLAEDDEDMRLLLAEQLLRDGFDVVTVEDGFELLDYLEACARGAVALPAVVVSDIRMPGQSALEVLRALPRLGVPIVLVSAFCDEETREEALKLGATSVLEKPVELDALSEEVRRVVAAAAITAASSR